MVVPVGLAHRGVLAAVPVLPAIAPRMQDLADEP
jgi:hypothetical protein